MFPSGDGHLELLHSCGLLGCYINEDPYRDVLKGIHTLPLNFLFSDWLVSKYTECIENG